MAHKNINYWSHSSIT